MLLRYKHEFYHAICTWPKCIFCLQIMHPEYFICNQNILPDYWWLFYLTLQRQLQIAKIKVRYIQGFFMCCMVTWLFQNLFLTIILSGWILMKFSCNGDKQDRIVTCQNYGGEKCVLESKGIYFAGVPRRCGNFGRLSQSL